MRFKLDSNEVLLYNWDLMNPNNKVKVSCSVQRVSVKTKKQFYIYTLFTKNKFQDTACFLPR